MENRDRVLQAHCGLPKDLVATAQSAWSDGSGAAGCSVLGSRNQLASVVIPLGLLAGSLPVSPSYVNGTARPIPVPADYTIPKPGGEERVGAGVVIDPDGMVLTVNALVLSCSRIAVAWPGQPALPATLIAADKRADLALLSVFNVHGSRYVRFSPPTPNLKPVEIMQYQHNAALARFDATEVADPLDLISSTAVFWAEGRKLLPSLDGSPVFEPTMGGVRGLVVSVYSRDISKTKLHLDDPVLAAVGNPIIDVFLQDAAARGHVLSAHQPTATTAADVTAATAIVVCAL